MDRSDIAFLIKETTYRDEMKIPHTMQDERMVYVDVSSVSADEWFEGGRNGLNPELRFRMFVGDYQDEKIIRYGLAEYVIYRTYVTKNGVVELYCQKRQGVQKNGKQA